LLKKPGRVRVENLFKPDIPDVPDKPYIFKNNKKRDVAANYVSA